MPCVYVCTFTNGTSELFSWKCKYLPNVRVAHWKIFWRKGNMLFWTVKKTDSENHFSETNCLTDDRRCCGWESTNQRYTMICVCLMHLFQQFNFGLLISSQEHISLYLLKAIISSVTLSYTLFCTSISICSHTYILSGFVLIKVYICVYIYFLISFKIYLLSIK